MMTEAKPSGIGIPFRLVLLAFVGGPITAMVYSLISLLIQHIRYVSAGGRLEGYVDLSGLIFMAAVLLGFVVSAFVSLVVGITFAIVRRRLQPRVTATVCGLAALFLLLCISALFYIGTDRQTDLVGWLVLSLVGMVAYYFACAEQDATRINAFRSAGS
ncbi:hypothetical protein [Gryllotalpicola ginsengisoli]|uniref:hypothetical protein n=1 Tax=Gryllotalpicola ginsengisoli TaxID=444608 RepID=UPI0003B6BA12|nr:hypothetical protein [Gryllotalpicola ginsengisoli]